MHDLLCLFWRETSHTPEPLICPDMKGGDAICADDGEDFQPGELLITLFVLEASALDEKGIPGTVNVICDAFSILVEKSVSVRTILS